MIEKTTIEKYTIRNLGEYAVIAIDEYECGNDYYGGDILIRSSLGNYCNSWYSCGDPFKKFLTKVDFDYFMNKCVGRDGYLEYDIQATVRNMVKSIIQYRIEGELSKSDARFLYDCVTSIGGEFYSIDEFSHEINNIYYGGHCGCDWVLSYYSDYFVRKPSDDTLLFWVKIWKPFIDQLKSEIK